MLGVVLQIRTLVGNNTTNHILILSTGLPNEVSITRDMQF